MCYRPMPVFSGQRWDINQGENMLFVPLYGSLTLHRCVSLMRNLAVAYTYRDME